MTIKKFTIECEADVDGDDEFVAWLAGEPLHPSTVISVEDIS